MRNFGILTPFRRLEVNGQFNSFMDVETTENIHIPCLLGSLSGRDIKASSKQWGAFSGIFSKPNT
jgi:hypothetical protein